MVDMKGCAIKVHRSLLQRDLMAGLPTAGLVLVLILAVIFLYLLKMYFMVVPIVILYLVMRQLTSKDPWMIDIVLDNIQQKDVFIP